MYFFGGWLFMKMCSWPRGVESTDTILMGYWPIIVENPFVTDTTDFLLLGWFGINWKCGIPFNKLNLLQPSTMMSSIVQELEISTIKAQLVQGTREKGVIEQYGWGNVLSQAIWSSVLHIYLFYLKNL